MMPSSKNFADLTENMFLNGFQLQYFQFCFPFKNFEKDSNLIVQYLASMEDELEFPSQTPFNFYLIIMAICSLMLL